MNAFRSFRLQRRERGATLVVVLILLVVMTILGLAAMRSTLLEERMSANMMDRSLGFQAAESALRQGEAVAAALAAPPGVGSGCSAGVCETPNAALTDRWMDPDFTGWANATDDLGALPAPATYIVEFMGQAPTWPLCDRVVPIPDLCLRPRYRVTAMSTAADRAQVLLQTNFIVQ